MIDFYSPTPYINFGSTPGRFLHLSIILQYSHSTAMSSNPRVHQVLSLIEAADLEYVEHNLLRSFVENAVDPTQSTEYITNRIDRQGSNSKEQVLRSIKDDWGSILQRCMRLGPD